MSIVERSEKPNAKRTNYGIDIRVGHFQFGEWALNESVAKEVNEVLIANGDKTISLPTMMKTKDGTEVEVLVDFSRRPVSSLSAALANLKASQAPVKL